MGCRWEAVNTTLKKHVSHHGTKVCNPAQNKSVPGIRNQKAIACFTSVSATNCLQVKWFLTAPKRRKSLTPSVSILPNFQKVHLLPLSYDFVEHSVGQTWTCTKCSLHYFRKKIEKILLKSSDVLVLIFLAATKYLRWDDYCLLVCARLCVCVCFGSGALWK